MDTFERHKISCAECSFSLRLTGRLVDTLPQQVAHGMLDATGMLRFMQCPGSVCSQPDLVIHFT